MDKPLFPSPAAGFDEPIDILDGCHQRIRRNCALIGRIAGHLPVKGADAEAAQAARGIMRYFDEAAAHHHEDEEGDLFPALRAAAPGPSTEALIARLLADHRRLGALWQDMRERLEGVIAGNSSLLAPDVAKVFHDAYEAHILAEEGELLPLARRVLDAATMERLGTAMASRRGVKRPG
jgi:hemerythrin-like domain-containing protein